MNPYLRQIVLSAVAAAGLGISVWHFAPASPTVSLVADRRAPGDVDAPTSGTSPHSLSASAPPRALPDADVPSMDTASRETVSSSVGAIRVQRPNGARPASGSQAENPFVEAPRRRLIIETIPPTGTAGQAAAAGAAPIVELQIELAPGVKEPIALVDSAANLTPVQARALAAIADEFADRIEQAADTLADEDFAATWDAEQASADAQYLAIFGAEAYHRKLAETAANAIAGKPVARDAAAAK